MDTLVATPIQMATLRKKKAHMFPYLALVLALSCGIVSFALLSCAVTQVRTLKDLDVCTETDKERVWNLLDNVLNKLCIRVIVDDLQSVDEDDASFLFIKEMRSRSNLFFHEASAAGA